MNTTLEDHSGGSEETSLDASTIRLEGHPLLSPEEFCALLDPGKADERRLDELIEHIERCIAQSVYVGDADWQLLSTHCLGFRRSYTQTLLGPVQEFTYYGRSGPVRIRRGSIP